MDKTKFARLWLVTVVLIAVLEGALGSLLEPAMAANGLMPWHQPASGDYVRLLAAGIFGGLAFAYIFVHWYRGGGWLAGLRFGIWVTVLVSLSHNLVMSALLPVGRRLPVEMVVVDLVTYSLCGISAAILCDREKIAVSASAG